MGVWIDACTCPKDKGAVVGTGVAVSVGATRTDVVVDVTETTLGAFVTPASSTQPPLVPLAL